jgi:acetate kinase
LFDLSKGEPHLLCKGLLDEHDAKPGFIVTDAAGNHLFENRRPAADNNGEALLVDILDWSNDYLAGGALLAAGHRVVHGGRDVFAACGLRLGA